MKRITIPEEGVETLFGSYDENLKHLESLFNVRIRTQGHELLVEGNPPDLELAERVDGERVGRYMERGTIASAPLAFMRGRTLNDSFVIRDEGQNTTSEQMKMFLTRLGFGAKAVITGDITQIDLPAGRTSGLVEAMKVVGAIEGISFTYFDDRDVVRHKLVQQIVKAYEAFSNCAGPSRPSTTRPLESLV